MSESPSTPPIPPPGAPFELVVELGKVREFARATFAPDDTDPGGADATPTAPPTFLTTSRLWEEAASDPWPALGLDPRRVLHAEQEFRFHGPPPTAGTRLHGRSRIEDVHVKDGRRGRLTFAVKVTEFRDDAGRLVAESRLTGVETAPDPEEDDA